MHIYKRRKTYWVKYMVDGKMHYVSTHTHKLAEARFFASSIDAARRGPTLEDAIAILKTIWRERPTDKMPLGDAWANYERIARTVGKLSVTPKTIKDRRNRVAAFLRWVEKNAATVKSVEDVTGKVAVLYAQHLASEGGKSKTRKNILTDLSTVWRILEKASPAIHNPWEGLTPQDVDSERGEAFTREEEQRVMEAARAIGKDWFEVCTVARWTGLRYGDVAMLRWRDVEIANTHSGTTLRGAGKTASVQQQERGATASHPEKTEAAGNAVAPRNVLRLTPSKTAKHGVTVTIPLVAPVVEALEKLQKRGDYVFPIHADMYDQNGGKDIMKFREVLDAAGIEGHTFHSWRHTFRTRLAEAGVDTETAMRLCGHTRVETSRRYDHDEHLGELRRAIEATR